MKFKYKKTVVVEEEVDVDDRVYNDESMAYRIANIILDGRLNYVYDDLYDENHMVVRAAAFQLNEAFKKADDILKLMD